MKTIKKKDALIVGFAIFAIFFGAGNIIFPPHIGLTSGGDVVQAIAGMTLTGILLPMLAIAAIGNMGDKFSDLTRHINSWWHILYMGVGLFIMLLGTMPRCGAVAYESGVLGMFPQLSPHTKYIFLFVFFGLAYVFGCNKSKVVDIIGKYMTPILLVFLVGIVVIAIVAPIGVPSGGVAKQPFTSAMLTAYFTGDVGTGLIFAGMFIIAIREKGYVEHGAQRRILFLALTVAFVLLFIVYGGMCYLGSTGTAFFKTDIDQTSLLVGLVKKLAGNIGIVALSLAIVMACFTTVTGVISVAAEWIDMATKRRFPFKLISLVVTIAMFSVATTGVKVVLMISGPLFTFIYPMSIVMTVLGVCKRFVPNDGVWKGAVYVATVMAFYDAFSLARSSKLISVSTEGLDKLVSYIPLANVGFSWLIPAIAGGIIGGAIWQVTGRKNVEDRLIK